MTCICCAAAITNWTYGGYRTPCNGCDVRRAANDPKHRRIRQYEEYAKINGDAALNEFRVSVRDEYERIKNLREQA